MEHRTLRGTGRTWKTMRSQLIRRKLPVHCSTGGSTSTGAAKPLCDFSGLFSPGAQHPGLKRQNDLTCLLFFTDHLVEKGRTENRRGISLLDDSVIHEPRDHGLTRRQEILIRSSAGVLPSTSLKSHARQLIACGSCHYRSSTSRMK